MGSMSQVKRGVASFGIDELRRLLDGTLAEVRAPMEAGYNQSIERWSRAAEKPAGVAIASTSAEEIAITVNYATEQGLNLAVKGRGHSTAGASSTNGGVPLDHGRMRNVTVGIDRMQLSIEGG